MINNFINKEIFGTVVELDNKIVGVEISYPHPSSNSYCVNLIRKALPSFKQGTEFLQVEHAKKCIEKGYITANDGSRGPINQMKFKEKLMGGTLSQIPIHYQSIYANKDVLPKDSVFMYSFATSD